MCTEFARQRWWGLPPESLVRRSEMGPRLRCEVRLSGRGTGWARCFQSVMVHSRARITICIGPTLGPFPLRRAGPASGENTRHSCRAGILGYVGLDPLERGSSVKTFLI
jgi:hypothetical protein